MFKCNILQIQIKMIIIVYILNTYVYFKKNSFRKHIHCNLLYFEKMYCNVNHCTTLFTSQNKSKRNLERARDILSK